MKKSTPIKSIKTLVAVRVIANGGKFLGDDISGAVITIHNEDTGELLASGTTAGGSGDIWEIMIQPRPRTQSIPVNGASLFLAGLKANNNMPMHLRISATGPGAGLQSKATTTTTQWIVPGLKDPKGKAIVWNCLLELPGLLVQVMQPATHQNVSTLPLSINFMANVAMMCGCPIDNNTDTDGMHSFPNPWPVADFIVGCYILNNGVTVDQVALQFNTAANIPGQYTGSWTMKQPGFYTGCVYAYQLSTGNTGTANVSFFNQPSA